MADPPGEVVLDRVFTIPNLISFARLLALPVFLWVYLSGHVLAATVILVVVGVSDFLDGFVARATGQVSNLGKLLDPLADRLVIIAVLVAFGARGTVPWILSGFIIARDVIIMAAFLALEKKGIPRLPVNRTGKRATASIFVGFGFAALGAVMKVSGVHGERSAAAGVHDTALVFLILGAALYWAAGYLYATEIRRGAARAGGTGQAQTGGGSR
ncbi:MAG TPA: CDP-alcohol phosphatidyltransferase family protein [Actinomycetota bacterium]|nr:CDP-alcohol phosphatidyltransferase family protein [Actinomycetota bacterium]